MGTYIENHWPEGTYLKKGYYPNMWWCMINGVSVKGYDCLLTAIAYINSQI